MPFVQLQISENWVETPHPDRHQVSSSYVSATYSFWAAAVHAPRLWQSSKRLWSRVRRITGSSQMPCKKSGQSKNQRTKQKHQNYPQTNNTTRQECTQATKWKSETSRHLSALSRSPQWNRTSRRVLLPNCQRWHPIQVQAPLHTDKDRPYACRPSALRQARRNLSIEL